jgi:hypothetical protein
MFEYIKSLFQSDDICVQVAVLTVVFIIVLIVVKHIVNNYFVEKFTDVDGYEKVAFFVRDNARSSLNDGKVDLQLGFPTENKEKVVE